MFVLVVVLPVKYHGRKHEVSVNMNLHGGPTWSKLALASDLGRVKSEVRQKNLA